MIGTGSYPPPWAYLSSGESRSLSSHRFSVLVTAYPGSREIGEPGPHAERMLDDARIEGSIGRMLAETLIVIARNLRQPRIATGPAPGRWVGNTGSCTERSSRKRARPPGSLAAVARRCSTGPTFRHWLVITNPGGLLGPVSVDTLGSAGVTSARNATLMQLLEDAVMPRTGEAIVEQVL